MRANSSWPVDANVFDPSNTSANSVANAHSPSDHAGEDMTATSRFGEYQKVIDEASVDSIIRTKERMNERIHTTASSDRAPTVIPKRQSARDAPASSSDIT